MSGRMVAGWSADWLAGRRAARLAGGADDTEDAKRGMRDACGEREDSMANNDALEALERLAAGERVVMSDIDRSIPSFGGKRGRMPEGTRFQIPGLYGKVLNATNMSPELLRKEQERLQSMQSQVDDYEANLMDVENKLIEKYGIPKPIVLENTIANGWKDDQTNVTAVGWTAGNPRNRKIWGLMQRDRTFHMHCLGGTGSGKAGASKTLVLTETGWRPLGLLEIGDLVYTRNGTLAPVKGIFDRGELRVYEVEFEDGTVIECSGDHLWYDVRNSHGVQREFVETTDAMLDAGVRSHWNSKRQCYSAFRHHVPLCQPIEFPEAQLPIDPYVLGCLLGDGCTTEATPQISSADQEIIDRLQERLAPYYIIKKCSTGYSWTISMTDEGRKLPAEQRLRRLLMSMNLTCRAEHKYIPDAYKYASVDQRIELIRGLMDTDGSASKGRFTFVSVSKQLRDDVAEVVRSLGLIAYPDIDYRPDKYLRTDNTAYTLAISSDDAEILFALSRKHEAYQTYREGLSERAVRDNTRQDPIRYEDGPSDNDLPFPPYALGVFLRSRIGTAGVFATGSNEFIRDKITGLFPENETSWAHQPNGHQKDGTPIMTWNFFVDGGRQRNGKRKNLALHTLRALGMDCKQQARLIPDIYMHASIQARQDLLQGILDYNGRFTDQTIEFYAKNPILAQQVCDLATSLGYIAEWSATKNSATTTVTIRISDTEMVSDPEKVAYIESILDRCLDTRRTERDSSLAIVDIRKTNRFEEMRCITVDDPTQSFIFEGYIVTHNSTLLANLIVDDAWFYRGGLLIDPHGDLAQTCLEAMPPYMLHNVVFLDVLDPDYSPGFNPLEFPPNATDAERAEAVAGVQALMTKHFNVDTGMARLVKNLENALTSLSYVPGATILDINDFFEYEEARATILSFMPEGVTKDAILSATENVKQDDIASLKNRLSRFQNNRFLKQLFGQSHTTVDFYDLMNKGAVVLCPIKKGATADDVFVKFYGSYIVSTIYKDSLRRESIRESDRIIFPLVIDEFQNFVTGDIENMLAELRKYGLAMILAHQYLDQISGGVAAAIDNSCKNKIVYTMNQNDAGRMAKSFEGMTAQDLKTLPKYNVMVSAFNHGGPMRPFQSAMFPPISGIKELAGVTQAIIKENSHRKYMKSREAIDAEIEERHQLLMGGDKNAIIDFANRMRKSTGQ